MLVQTQDSETVWRDGFGGEIVRLRKNTAKTPTNGKDGGNVMKRVSSALRAKEQFIEMCHAGEFQPGQKLPSEIDMARRFGVSRETWRSSLELLRREGRVYSKHGSGTYLLDSSRKMENNLSQLRSTSEMISQAGLVEGPSECKCGLVIPPAEVASALGLRSSMQVFYITRVRYTCEGSMICASTLYVPVFLADEINPMCPPESLYQYFEDCKGIRISRSSTQLSVPTESDPLAALIYTNSSVPVLGMNQVHYDSRGNAVMYSIDRMRGDLFHFSVTRIREK